MSDFNDSMVEHFDILEELDENSNRSQEANNGEV